MKIRLHHAGGVVDRVPAYIRRAVVDPHHMGARYDGVCWHPPPQQQYQWWAVPTRCLHVLGQDCSLAPCQTGGQWWTRQMLFPLQACLGAVARQTCRQSWTAYPHLCSHACTASWLHATGTSAAAGLAHAQRVSECAPQAACQAQTAQFLAHL